MMKSPRTVVPLKAGFLAPIIWNSRGIFSKAVSVEEVYIVILFGKIEQVDSSR